MNTIDYDHSLIDLFDHLTELIQKNNQTVSNNFVELCSHLEKLVAINMTMATEISTLKKRITELEVKNIGLEDTNNEEPQTNSD